MKRLFHLAKTLRNPEYGCPWDQKQTLQSFPKCLQEEAQEVADAAANENWENLCEELGDTLFNLVFMVNLAEEKKLFSWEDVLQQVHSKLVYRHPHVFGSDSAQNSEDAYSSFMNAKNTKITPRETITLEEAEQELAEHIKDEENLTYSKLVAEMMWLLGKDEEPDQRLLWRICGLVHAIDREYSPSLHPLRAFHILQRKSYPQQILQAILCDISSPIRQPETPLEDALWLATHFCQAFMRIKEVNIPTIHLIGQALETKPKEKWVKMVDLVQTFEQAKQTVLGQ